MHKIKVLMSSRPKLLSEVIQNLVERQEDMEVVGSVLDPLQLINTIKKLVVDVIIITPLKANGEPKICQLLLVEYPLLIIVTQSTSGDAAHLYRAGVPKLRLPEASGESILNAIRESVRSVREQSNGSRA